MYEVEILVSTIVFCFRLACTAVDTTYGKVTFSYKLYIVAIILILCTQSNKGIK